MPDTCPMDLAADLRKPVSMWLAMEKRAAHLLNVLHEGGLEIPDSPGRESLVLLAAHTRLPEASVLAMPSVAQSEIAFGLGGPLRERIASETDDEPELEALRDALLLEVGSWCNADTAVGICDAVHGGRLLRRESPAVVGADLIRWYQNYRHADDRTNGPGSPMVEAMERCYDAWVAEPGRREAIEAEIYDHVLEHFGDVPAAFIDRDV